MNSRIVFAGNLSLVIALKPYDYIANINNSGTGRLGLIITSNLVDEVFFDERFFEEVLAISYHEFLSIIAFKILLSKL